MERVGLLFICGDGGSFTTYQLFAAFVLLLMIENVQVRKMQASCLSTVL